MVLAVCVQQSHTLVRVGASFSRRGKAEVPDGRALSDLFKHRVFEFRLEREDYVLEDHLPLV